MSDIAIVHPDLMSKGGAESVCMHAIEALEADHDLTLLTVTDPDLDELDDYYNTSTGAVDVRRVDAATRWFNAVVEKRIVDLPVPRLRLLELALFDRFVGRVAETFDLVVSTYNEYRFGVPSVQYIHHPNYYLDAFPGGPDRAGSVGRAYTRASRRVAGFDFDALSSATLLANSAWTAAEFADIYGYRPDVLHPPVDTTGFDGLAWEDRESGFVIVSRISPDKRVLQGIRIVDRLVAAGHDVHVHIVGSRTSESYGRRIESFVADRPHVHVEGELPRTDLADLVGRHRYGLHTKPFEHFGISVAELVAGGTLPFVPDSGGQREIIEDKALTYSSIDEAVRRIEAVLGSTERQHILRESLPDVVDTYGCERFERDFRGVIDRALEGPEGR